ncbi:MAG TPA: GNAT family N-acyltransferase [Burkholderiales bacterium]|nr:GNAT family N-acyltransferase [Burkholderiales bacterium]
MRLQQQPGIVQSQARLMLQHARTPAEIAEAQHLRYKIFAGEMGARVPGRETGTDSDEFDLYCDHLLVRDADSGHVVGTYRVLSSAMAHHTGGFYSDREFDLTRLDHLRDETVEIGRSCVHPEYRNGATIALLWSGIAQYMQTHGYRYLIGCASVGIADGGHVATAIYNTLQKTSLSPAEYRVFPRCELPLAALDPAAEAPLPSLIKGYVRVGAYICGAPAWDPDFNTADLLMMLPMSRMNPRYARHFLKADC